MRSNSTPTGAPCTTLTCNSCRCTGACLAERPTCSAGLAHNQHCTQHTVPLNWETIKINWRPAVVSSTTRTSKHLQVCATGTAACTATVLEQLALHQVVTPAVVLRHSCCNKTKPRKRHGNLRAATPHQAELHHTQANHKGSVLQLLQAPSCN